MGRIRNFLSRPAADQRLLVEAACLVISARLVLWTIPFPWVRSITSRIARPVSRVPRSSPLRLSAAVEQAARYVPHATCLTRSLATHVLLRRSGHPCTVRIGVRRSPTGGLEAHAWVQSGSTPLGSVAEIQTYAMLPPL